MTKIAYLDCPTGIAGDMCLGALVHAGVPLEYLVARLGQLGIATEYDLWAESVQRNGQQATKVHVDLRVDAVSSDGDRAHTETMHHMSHLHHSPTEPPTVTEPTVTEPTVTEPAVVTEPTVTHAHSHAHSHSHEPHSHEPHNHESHNHEPYSHEPHSHNTHNHEPHSHEPHSHEPHSHNTHNHEPHSHEPHSHEPHNHESHNHEPYSHETHSHNTHSHNTHSHETHSHSHSNHYSQSENSQSESDHKSQSHASTLHDAHAHGLVRHLPEVERLILAARLPARAEAWSLAVFRKLAEAEGAIHGVPPEQVHFHEVGATDAIVDIVGTCLGLDWLGIDHLYCSPLPTGGGTIRAAHGRLPVPAPAVLKLFELRQVPLYSNGIDREMVTPTGAAIATTLATQFGAPPPMTLQRVGLGAGSISLPLPNILRLWLGESGVGSRESGVGSRESGVGSRESGVRSRVESQTQNAPLTSHLTPHTSPETQHSTLSPTPHTPHPTLHTSSPIALLETQIDDLSPQAIGYVYEVLFAVGALDVFTQAIGMKKSRPGILLTVVCDLKDVAACEAVLFRETTTLGIRRSLQERTALHREMQSVETAYGMVQVKVAWLDRNQSQPTNVQPEYEDCARLAKQHQRPWREVHRLALEAWYEHHHP